MRRAAILALSVVGGVGISAPALADSCVDLRTGATYDCAGKPPEPSPPAKKRHTDDTRLRRDLKAALARAARREKQLQAAIAAAGQACKGGDQPAFDRRMATAAGLARPEEMALIENLRANCGGPASRNEASPKEEPAPAVAAAPQEAGAKPTFGDGDRRREQAWAKLSPRCKGLVNRLLKGADAGDNEALLSSYGMLRAECDRQLRALAAEADSDLPERSLSPRASSALARAMSRDPNQLVQSLPDRADDSAFDPGEIADFALGLLSVMPSARGFYTPMSNGRSAAFAGGAFRRQAVGAVRPRPPPQSESTITGGSR